MYQFPFIIIDLFFIFQWVIAYFVSNFVAMATRVGLCKIRRHCLIAWHRKTPVRCKHLREICHTSRVITALSEISLPRQRRSLVAEFLWHHSIARSRKPPTRSRRKHLGWYFQHKLSYSPFCLKFRWNCGPVLLLVFYLLCSHTLHKNHCHIVC